MPTPTKRLARITTVAALALAALTITPALASADQAQIVNARIVYDNQHPAMVDVTSNPLPTDNRAEGVFTGAGPFGSTLAGYTQPFIMPSASTPAVTLPSSRYSVVTGQVIDAQTGQPAAGQDVTLNTITDGQDSATALTTVATGPDGTFAAIVPAGVDREVVVSCCTYQSSAAADAPGALTLSDAWGAYVNSVDQPTVHVAQHGNTMLVTGSTDLQGAWVQVYTSVARGPYQPVFLLAKTSTTGSYRVSFKIAPNVVFAAPRSGHWPKAEVVSVRATIGTYQGKHAVVYQPGYQFAQSPDSYDVGVQTVKLAVKIPAAIRATPIP